MKRQRQGERETETERERDRDRERGRQRQGERETETGRERDRERERQGERERDSPLRLMPDMKHLFNRQEAQFFLLSLSMVQSLRLAQRWFCLPRDTHAHA